MDRKANRHAPPTKFCKTIQPDVQQAGFELALNIIKQSLDPELATDRLSINLH